MFRDQGYDASRIEDIAEAAESSVATFYNYFGSKADLLLAAVVAETDMVMAAVDAVIDRRGKPPEAAFAAIVATYFEKSFQYTSREVWRQAVARTMLDPDAEFCRRYIEIDAELARQLGRFLEGLQARGAIRADLEAGPVARLLFNNVNMNFIEYMRDPDMSPEAVCAKVMAESAAVFAHLAA